MISPDGGGTSFRKTTLDNGMRVVTSTMPHARSVGISVFVGVGSRYDAEDRAGISHVIEHLVFKGTQRRPAPDQISGVVEGVGGVLNAGTEQELTVYWCKVARRYLDDCVDLLIDMLRNSVFDPTEIEKERMVVIEEQNMANDHPGHRVETLMDELLWPAHPLGRDIAGTRESVSDMTREMMMAHVEQFYSPSNIAISIAGNVEHEEVVTLVESLCRGWSPRRPPACTPFADTQQAPQLRLEYRKTEQTQVSIGLPGLSITHPDRYAVDMLSVVLGEGMSSRLFMEVRERQGLAYDIHSGVSHFQDCGAFVVDAGIDPKRVDDAVETVLVEVGRLREGVPEEELERAKRLSTGLLVLRMEDTRAVSSWAGSHELLLGHVLDVDEVSRLVEGVTTDDMARVANDLLLTEKLNMAVVGPRRAERRFLRALKL